MKIKVLLLCNVYANDRCKAHIKRFDILEYQNNNQWTFLSINKKIMDMLGGDVCCEVLKYFIETILMSQNI